MSDKEEEDKVTDSQTEDEDEEEPRPKSKNNNKLASAAPVDAKSIEERATEVAEKVVAETSVGSKEKELDKGKDAYNRGDYKEAIKAWQCSLKSVKYVLDKGLYKEKPEQLQEVYDMEHKMAVNLAQGYLKTEEYNKAIEAADQALNRVPKSTKAMYRKASAYMSLLSFEEAQTVLKELLEVEPSNAAAKQMLAEAERNTLVSGRRAKRMSQRIFGGSASTATAQSPWALFTWFFAVLLQLLQSARQRWHVAVHGTLDSLQAMVGMKAKAKTA